MAKSKSTPKSNFPKSVPIVMKVGHSSDSQKPKPKHDTMSGKFYPPGWRGTVDRNK